MSAPAGLSQAAMMVLLFDEADAAAILAEMSPDDLRVLGREMAGLEPVQPKQVAAAIAAFCDRAEPGVLPRAGEPDAIRAVFENAVGPIKADGVLRAVTPAAPPRREGALALLGWLSVEALLILCEGENPQVIAALLCQIEAETAARVLGQLDDTVQAEVVHRIATLRPIAPAAMALLGDLVEQRLAASFGALPLAYGGVQEAAAIVNHAARAVEQRVMPAIDSRDTDLAQQMERAMFRFDMLRDLDAKAMGQVLREVETETLVTALKAVEADARAPFLDAMSSRAADGIRDEIDAGGRVKLADAEAAQREIVAAARRLAEEGKIAFGDGGDDYV